MINIYINKKYLGLLNASDLQKTALAVLEEYADNPDCDLTIAVEDSDKVRELNNQFLGIDAPTDVLSFPSGETSVSPETGHLYLGDIIISYPTTSDQAKANGNSILAEITMLVVHGTLHLLGYDHEERVNKEVMWSAQKSILNRIGIDLHYHPE